MQRVERNAPRRHGPRRRARRRPAPVRPVAGTCPTSQPPALPAGETRTVTLTTEKGDIVIKIKADLSPIAAGNFVALAECGWYDERRVPPARAGRS